HVARTVARGLIGIGVEKGDRVAVWATNVPEWIILQFALAKIGAILVTVNTSLRSHELEYLLGQSESSTLFTISGFKDVDYVGAIYDVVPEAKSSQAGNLQSSKLPFLRRLIFIGDETPEGFLNFKELSQSSEKVSEAELDKQESRLDLDEAINIQYTSGTTGF